MARSVCCAAAAGSATRGSRVRPTGAGSGRPSAATWASALPEVKTGRHKASRRQLPVGEQPEAELEAVRPRAAAGGGLGNDPQFWVNKATGSTWKKRIECPISNVECRM